MVISSPSRTHIISSFALVVGLFMMTALAQGPPIISSEGSATSVGGNNRIEGFVHSETGQAINRRIRVVLMTQMRGQVVAYTNENGRFAFNGLPPGSYTVLVEKENDFENFSQAVDIVQFRGAPSTVMNVNVRLKPKVVTEAKPAVVNAEFAGVPKEALKYYSAGVEKASTGDRQGAIEQFKLAVAEHPRFLQAFNEMGVQYMRLNELDHADEAFGSALKLNPESFAALVNRGILNVMRKRFGEAVPVLKKAKKIDDASAVCRYFLGQALANLGLFDEAEKELNSALSLGKEQMKEAHRVLAIIYNARGDKKRAAAELEEYLRLSPGAPDAEQLRQAIKQMRDTADDPTKPSN
ncbi:MAG TPA: tetratricopeptide repeat protein [Pyrinomonadaceae bacterium]|nr:tetratricopeptide repeat protein [Pyrinomonadaceae bacterium]